MIRPNKTPVQATLVEKRKDEFKCWLKIVLINIYEKDKLPAFLSIGKLLEAECHRLEIMEELSPGDIFKADIEVTGNPFNQHFILSEVSVDTSLEEE